MSPTRRTHILFDFFGTLVDYSERGSDEGYPRSHELVLRWGGRLSYPRFLAEWSRVWAGFDRTSERDDREFSMADAGTAFLSAALGRVPDAGEVRRFVDTYLDEWNAGVRYPPGVDVLLTALAADHRLAVVSNTHHADLVPRHLAAMGLTAAFDAVITSIGVGWRKPHPAIYAAALSALGVPAEAAVFVGDSLEPDFLGPRRAGIHAFLIDPLGRAPVPEPLRLASVFDLPARLAGPAHQSRSSGLDDAGRPR